MLQLTVDDGNGATHSDSVQITTNNVTPVADAGLDQTGVVVGAQVTLDGSNSTDADGDTLGYAWSITGVPTGSSVTTASLVVLPDPATPSFYTDVAGTYVVQLIVNDGTVDSTPATVTITTQ